MPIHRRAFLASSLALLTAGPGKSAEELASSPWPTAETISLWPGAIPNRRAKLPTPRYLRNVWPGSREVALEGVDNPAFRVYRPQHPTGQGLLVLPGGSYKAVAIENEGLDAARTFNAMGITVFILTYRLPNEGWDRQFDVPLQDAQRAMRVIRSRAEEFGIDAARLAVLGFSAGGHAAATLTTCYDETVYQPVDAADRLSARPAFSGLIYPVIDLRPPLAHMESRENLLGANPSDALLDARSPQLRVTANTPPCFLAHALDDGAVPYGNSVAMIDALRAKTVPCELHLFEKGGHGFGFHLPKDYTGSRWPDLFRAWIMER